jgi:hypothetical protein
MEEINMREGYVKQFPKKVALHQDLIEENRIFSEKL